MSAYTITITPDNGEHASTTVRVDVDAAAARITELTIRAGEGGGLSARQLPAVDLELLMRAIAPATLGTALAPSTTDGVSDDAPAPASRPRRGRAKATAPRAREAVKATTGGRRGRRAKATADGGRAAKRTGQRAYRRMPDDVVDVFRDSGSVTALAAHYGVPRHTAQGWVGRLRRQKLLPPGR